MITWITWRQEARGKRQEARSKRQKASGKRHRASGDGGVSTDLAIFDIRPSAFLSCMSLVLCTLGRSHDFPPLVTPSNLAAVNLANLTQPGRAACGVSVDMAKHRHHRLPPSPGPHWIVSHCHPALDRIILELSLYFPVGPLVACFRTPKS